MTCTNVRRMHGKVETPAKPRNGRIVIGVLLAVLLVCVAVGVALHLRNVEIEQQTQVQLRDDFVAELERNEGTYDAQSMHILASWIVSHCLSPLKVVNTSFRILEQMHAE